jgi:hypothetical protein
MRCWLLSDALCLHPFAHSQRTNKHRRNRSPRKHVPGAHITPSTGASPLLALPDVCAAALAASLPITGLRSLVETCKDAIAMYRPCVSSLDLWSEALPKDWDETRLRTELTKGLTTFPGLTKVYIGQWCEPLATVLRMGLQALTGDGRLQAAQEHKLRAERPCHGRRAPVVGGARPD